MRLPSRFHVGLVLASAALPVSCGGCERRVEEPLPEVRPLTSVAAEPSALVTTTKPWGARCVREHPRTPRPTTPPSPDPACPPDPEKAPALGTGKVTFADAGATTITVEIARNDHDRQRGLMYRKSMPADRGMIFWFEDKTDHAFWMHNTCIPLDMLYLDDDGLIVGIEENTPTMVDQTFDVGCASRYVLEVNAGFSRAHGVVPGQKVRIEGI